MAKKNEYQDRAKIFLSFAALKGFEEALKEKEKIIVKKKTISEDMKMTISYRLSSLKKNDMVRVVYYDNGEYIKLQGMVSKIDPTFQELTVVKTKINFSDIYELRIIEKNDKI